MELSRKKYRNLIMELGRAVDSLRLANNEIIQQQEDIASLESENAELNKFLKHARKDKAIRLKEIEVLERNTAIDFIRFCQFESELQQVVDDGIQSAVDYHAAEAQVASLREFLLTIHPDVNVKVRDRIKEILNA